MRVYGDSCENIYTAEESGVSALSYLYANLCERIGGMALQVWRTSDGTWTDAWGRKVAGLTWCDFATVEVGDANWATNAYWHELAHVAQCPYQDIAHETWETLGIWATLEKLYSKPETRYKEESLLQTPE